MIDLPKKTEYIRVHHCRLVTTPQLEKRYAENIDVLNKAYQYTVKYLEKTYGYTRLESRMQVLTSYLERHSGVVFARLEDGLFCFPSDGASEQEWSGLLRDLEEQHNRDFGNVLAGLVPRSMIGVMIERTEIPSNTKANSVTRQQRRLLLEELKGFRLTVTGKRPVAEAIVTSGGVKTGEVDPKTMASKKVPGLYFAGEILDCDAYTGGFNLQIAWSTGYSAGRSI